MTGHEIPRRLIDLDPETIGWLDRLNTDQRDALIWAGRLPEDKRKRLDQFLSLDEEKFKAGFTMVEIWTRLRWISVTSMKIILSVAGLLLAFDAILRWFAASGGKP
jgi:hypothetical protein